MWLLETLGPLKGHLLGADEIGDQRETQNGHAHEVVGHVRIATTHLILEQLAAIRAFDRHSAFLTTRWFLIHRRVTKSQPKLDAATTRNTARNL